MESTEIIKLLMFCAILVLLCIIEGLHEGRENDRGNGKKLDFGINMDCERRRQFLCDSAVYFENGLIHEIYHTKNYSICNFANDSHVLMMYPFSYRTRMYDRKHGTLGLFLTTKFIKGLIRDPGLIRIIDTHHQEEAKNSIFRLSQESLPIAKKIKAERDLNGPSDAIDLEMEKVLLAAKETGSRPDVNHPVFDVTHQSVEKQNKAD